VLLLVDDWDGVVEGRVAALAVVEDLDEVEDRRPQARWCRPGRAVDGHVECVQDQFGAQVLGHRPAHHLTRERVQDHREVQPALAGALLGDVSNPQPVRPGRHEVARCAIAPTAARVNGADLGFSASSSR
jgi:hypothetical protein